MAVDDAPDLAVLLPHLASLLADVPVASPVAVGMCLVPDGFASTADRGTKLSIDSFEAGSGQVEFLFRHLDCADVVCALGGFVAPQRWDVFGIIAPARCTPADPAARHPPDRDGGAPEHNDVTACALVARTGLVVSELRSVDGALVTAGPTEGRVVDACRRALGLRTAPSTCGPRVWYLLLWIDRMLAAVLGADLGHPPSWEALAALERTASPSTWRGLRTACARGRIEVPGISPCGASWMDDGMFGREAIGVFAPLLETLGDLRDLLPSSTFERLVERVSEHLGA